MRNIIYFVPHFPITRVVPIVRKKCDFFSHFEPASHFVFCGRENGISSKSCTRGGESVPGYFIYVYNEKKLGLYIKVGTKKYTLQR